MNGQCPFALSEVLVDEIMMKPGLDQWLSALKWLVTGIIVIIIQF